jgi:adenylate kinase family enzyme
VSELIVVTGPPGAGKSTVARVLVGRLQPSALVSGDDFFAMIERGYVAPWTTAARRQNEVVVGAAGAAAGRLVQGGYTTVFDGVIGPWFLETFRSATGLDRIRYALLLPPEELCLERVRSRLGHGFGDLDAAAHMYREFTDAEVAKRHVLSSSAPPESLATAILELVSDGSLRWP